MSPWQHFYQKRLCEDRYSCSWSQCWLFAIRSGRAARNMSDEMMDVVDVLNESAGPLNIRAFIVRVGVDTWVHTMRFTGCRPQQRKGTFRVSPFPK